MLQKDNFLFNECYMFLFNDLTIQKYKKYCNGAC